MKLNVDNVGKVYHVGLYIRLSREDDDKVYESESITNQKSLLLQYVKENNLNVYDIYIDDGYSGTNFDRPDFNRLLNDIELGKINMVIMGRKTYESLPTYPSSLPNRINSVITSKARLLEENEYDEYVVFFENIEEVLGTVEECEKIVGLDNEYFIIGGGTIYKQFLPLCDKIYLTEVNQEFPEADTYFKYNKGEFKVVEESEEKEENGFKFKFETLERVYQD